MRKEPNMAGRSIKIAALALAASLASTPIDAAPARKPLSIVPNLAVCPKSVSGEMGISERIKPLPIPAQFAGLVRADMDHFAVATMAGTTVCIDTGWMDATARPKLSPDKRFLGFAWSGLDAFGYVFVDRSGKGMAIETGTAPLTSPSGRRLAAIDLSPSGFGGLNAFAVWLIDPADRRLLAREAEGWETGDWRIDGWVGDDCVNFSLLPIGRRPDKAGKIHRDQWYAAESRRWAPRIGRCPGPT
jgi:hypothetical protein